MMIYPNSENMIHLKKTWQGSYRIMVGGLAVFANRALTPAL